MSRYANPQRGGSGGGPLAKAGVALAALALLAGLGWLSLFGQPQRARDRH